MQDHATVLRFPAPTIASPDVFRRTAHDLGTTPARWADLDPDLEFEDPSFGSLLAWWEGKRRGRPLPVRGDLDPVEIKAHLGRICLIEIEPRPFRLRYRLFGSEIARDMGRDVTGRGFEQVYPAHVLEPVTACACWVVERRRPLRTFGRVHWPDREFFRYETVDLPLAGEDGSVVMLVRKLAVRTASSEAGAPRSRART